MKYCLNCKHIHNDEDKTCSVCSGSPAEITEENTPVFLISASGFELERIKTTLEDNGIPCECKHNTKNVTATTSTGYDNSKTDILIPYSAYEKAYDICVGIGAIKDEDTQIIDDGTVSEESKNGESLDEQFEEMSGAKRTTVRVISAILFIALVAIVVYGTDAIMAFIKNLLQ